MLGLASFQATLVGLGLSPDDQTRQTFAQLVAAYSDPARHYHNSGHIAACLSTLARHADLAEKLREVEVAIWFHDAIYDTRRSNNEERSAAWAIGFLSDNGLEPDAVERIQRLILATKHDGTAQSSDQRLLVDVDLAILGQSAPAFQAYDAAIRQEYSWVPPPQYRAGRIAVLQSLFDRAQIYMTERFRQLYEQPARENLRRAIVELQAESS